jgi:RNA polymerase sigma-70 factor (sigma-E family)
MVSLTKLPQARRGVMGLILGEPGPAGVIRLLGSSPISVRQTLLAARQRFQLMLSNRLQPDAAEFTQLRWGGSGRPVTECSSPPDPGTAICELYGTHYRPLVRLAALLIRDTATAEEVVQDSFVAVHFAWHRLRDTDKALAYLRQSVVNRSRSVLRHRAVAEKHAAKLMPDAPAAEQGALTLLERSAVTAALRSLPPRQREALVLRYYADLSEADIAKTMGISRGAVKSHTARGITALRAVLKEAL